MTMKRISAFLLILALLLSLMALPVWAEDTDDPTDPTQTEEPEEPEEPVVTASGVCGSAMTWSLVEGMLTISGTGSMYDFNFVLSPVFSCESPWFGYAGSITSVVVDAGVTSIGRCAFFGLSNLTSVSLPDTVTALGAYSFEGCTALTDLSLPDAITRIDSSAFYGCTGLTYVRMPENLTQIGDAAFYGCTGLRSVSFAEDIASIADHAFAGCTALANVDYEGTEEDWEQVQIGFDNDPLRLAEMLFESMTYHHHTLLRTEATDPTCTEDGNILYFTCTVCQELFLDNHAAQATTAEDVVIPALDHDWDEGVVLMAPSKISTGLMRYTCRHCSKVRTELIPSTYVPGADDPDAIITTITGLDDGSFRVEFIRGSTGEVVEQLDEPRTIHLPVSTGDVVIVEAASKQVIRKSIVEDGVASFVLDRSETVRTIYNAKPFVDVEEDAWYAGAVDFASGHELFQGITHAQFGPDMEMTRAMLVTVLWRLEGSPDMGTSNPFPDVADDAYYSQAVTWGQKNGVVEGYDDGRFHPDVSVTREQMAAFLFRYMNSIGGDTDARGDLTEFADADSLYTWAKDPMAWCVGTGIIRGRGASMLAPKGTATRAEVATMMMRLVRLITL